MRRLPIVAALAATATLVLGVAGTALAAPTQDETDPGRVSVLKVEGLLDPVLVDWVEESIHAADDAGMVAIVLRIDSAGAVVSDRDLNRLAETMRDADLPVAVWVGPSGARATGGAAQIAGAADLLGLAPGARLGKTGDLVIDESLLSPAFLAARERLAGSTLNDDQARDLGLVPEKEAPIIGEFLLEVPGFQAKAVEVDGRTVSEPLTVPVFSALPIHDQLFHTVASPPVAYLLLLVGLSLIVFELYTAGVGVAGLVGAGSLVLACYGLAVLPTRPIAIGLLVLAMFGFTVDVQTGVPRLWSGIGTVALIAGSLLLYDGLALSWIALAVGIVGVPLAMVGGMPAMVRTRFSTPTIGREWMVGEEGEAVTAVSPDGVVRVRGALWRARTNRATPIEVRGPIRVVEVDGLLLEVEPLEGGASDYRERRRSGGEGDGAGSDAEPGVVLVDGRPLDSDPA